MGGRPIHQLYDVGDRRKHFAQCDWRNLIQVAERVARAFATIHNAGFCVVDVSESNVLVTPTLQVYLIDCDSCVRQDAGKDSISSIATPLWIVPELVGVQDTTPRTPNHDNFLLARLLFFLLFDGSEPMIAAPGKESGATGERVFGFSRKNPVRTPLPSELRLTDLPSPVAAMFENAFAPRVAGSKPRPTAQQWADGLNEMVRTLSRCSVVSAHWRIDGQACPWCAMAERIRDVTVGTGTQRPAPKNWIVRHPVAAGLLLVVVLLLGGNALTAISRRVPVSPVLQPEPRVPGPSVPPLRYASTPSQSQFTAPPPVAAPAVMPIADLQRQLSALGLDAGPPDGVIGPRTREALRAFSLALGRPESTDVNEDVSDALQGTPPSAMRRGQALAVLAKRALGNHDLSNATRLLLASEKLFPDPELFVQFGSAAVERGDTGAAWNWWQRALAITANPARHDQIQQMLAASTPPPSTLPAPSEPPAPSEVTPMAAPAFVPLRSETSRRNDEFDRGFLGAPR